MRKGQLETSTLATPDVIASNRFQRRSIPPLLSSSFFHFLLAISVIFFGYFGYLSCRYEDLVSLSRPIFEFLVWVIHFWISVGRKWANCDEIGNACWERAEKRSTLFRRLGNDGNFRHFHAMRLSTRPATNARKTAPIRRKIRRHFSYYCSTQLSII